MNGWHPVFTFNFRWNRDATCQCPRSGVMFSLRTFKLGFEFVCCNSPPQRLTVPTSMKTFLHVLSQRFFLTLKCEKGGVSFHTFNGGGEIPVANCIYVALLT